MSILKAIMHHYNATNKNYDTLHPETEASQITDWHSGIMASLASKTLGTVVDAVTTDSVLGKLIKLLLTASGVKYLIDTNGYICFGSLFGGLIIQWGRVSGAPNDAYAWEGKTEYEAYVNAITPIQFTKSPLFAVANVLTDASGVVDEKAECCDLNKGGLGVKIACSHQGETLTACYFILGY